MRPFLSLSLVLATACVSAQAYAQSPNVPEDERKGFTALIQDDLHHDISFLASDHLQGRMSMQPGDDLAVQWIAGQFAKAGFDPIAIRANGLPSYEQSFDIIEYRPDRANSTVTMMRGGQPTVWHAPEAFGAFKHPVNITAPVVFAGYGITAPGMNYDDYANIDAKGKIVLIFDHEPQENDPQSVFYGIGNTKYATTRVKLLNAQMHGAVAVLVVAEPNRKHPTNAERAARIGGSLQRATPLALQAIDDDELKIPLVTVNDDVAKALLATSGTTGSDLQTKIDTDLKPEGLILPDTSVSLHLRNVSEDSGTINNVVALLKGSDPQLSPETIIISAHHDHDGTAPCPAGKDGVDQTGQPTPSGPDCVETWHGADDNASGTAGVIALARAFGANGAKPRRSILFVVFAGEERGLLGSYWMAQHPLRPLSTTRAMINFDMIGRDEKASPQTDGLMDIPADTSNRLNLVGAEYSPEYAKVVAGEDNTGVNLLLDDRFDHDAALNVLFRSDQFPFLLRNVPAMWWFTGFHPDYHHITDTAEKIDYAKMTKILELAYLTSWRFANDASTPAFVENPVPPPPAPAASADAPAPAADQPAPPRHHRPIIPVSIAPTTIEASPAAASAVEPADTHQPVAPVALPAAAPASAVPPVAAPVTTTTTVQSAPVQTAPVSVPASAVVAPPEPSTRPASSQTVTTTTTVVAAPIATSTPVVDSPPAETPVHHRRRAITPVQIQATTGEAGEPATGDPASTISTTPQPVAPITVNTTGTDTTGTATNAGSAVRPPVAAVALAPGQVSKPVGTTPLVTPVKLGGKQPGQDEYDDPQ